MGIRRMQAWIVEQRRSGSRGLSEGESLPLAFLFDWPAALDSRLLLLELQPLAFQLLFHLSVPGVQLLFALLQLGLLLGDLLLEDHLHLGLHLGELLLVEGALLLLLDSWVDLLEDTWVLRDTHLDELVCSVVLIEEVVGVLLELFHVGPDEHLAELNEVAVFLIVDLNDTPWVLTTAHLAPVGICDLTGGTDDSKRNLGHYLVVLGDGLLVVELVTRAFKDLHVVVLDVCQDLSDC